MGSNPTGIIMLKKRDKSLYNNLIEIKGLGNKRVLKLCLLIGTHKDRLLKDISGVKQLCRTITLISSSMNGHSDDVLSPPHEIFSTNVSVH